MVDYALAGLTSQPIVASREVAGVADAPSARTHFSGWTSMPSHNEALPVATIKAFGTLSGKALWHASLVDADLRRIGAFVKIRHLHKCLNYRFPSGQSSPSSNTPSQSLSKPSQTSEGVSPQRPHAFRRASSTKPSQSSSMALQLSPSGTRLGVHDRSQSCKLGFLRCMHQFLRYRTGYSYWLHLHRSCHHSRCLIHRTILGQAYR